MDTIYDAKLLLVDDNAELLALLCEQLRGAGYGHIRTAQSCTAARACFAAEQPELMILDINLPDGDGFSLFRALRAKADVPALFLSARDADADRLFGLGLGADDYLTKPFLMQELLLRVQTVRLPTDGFAGELAEKLNQTGAQLQAKNEMLSRRDNARTQWIAGVSHDVRTPLALILGWAEQLEQDALLPGSSRQKAAGIRTQCEKLRTLIDDLNLTSKLEYGAQPLRRKDLRAGPLFRQLVAQFCESPLAERCGITLEQEEPAEQTVLLVDEALLARLLENLLNNSVRHNPKPVNITVHTRQAGERFCLTVADDGIGYPPAVLAALNAAEPAENAPHILGLYVVQQIAAAHGGRAVFGQNTPHGAKAVVYLPLG